MSSVELFSYAEHQSESRRRSTNVCESRQVVRQQAGASTCIIVYIAIISYSPICVHLLNCHFYISSLFHR